MADISTYIQWIQNAQYGEEVRSAIINAITKINEDNESYVEIKNEVVAAKDFVDEKIIIVEIAKKILELLTAENASADSNIKELKNENSKNQDLLTALEELHDIRKGVDKTVYDSAGESVRTQIKMIADEKVTRPTTGEVGQVLSVKSTDESGKPVEFEAKDMSGGGASKEEIEEVVNGYLEEKKEELKGEQGEKGEDGITPHIGENGNWYMGDTDTGVYSKGADGQPGKDGEPGRDGQDGKDGAPGEPGVDGKDGTPGADGKSAYQYAQEGGYTGTEEEFAQKLATEYPTDVTINGTSIVEDGVAVVPVAEYNKTLGVVFPHFGLQIAGVGQLRTNPAGINEINNRHDGFRPLVAPLIDNIVRAAMCDGKGEAWTDTEKTGAWSRLSSIKTAMDEVAVAGANYLLGEQTEVTVVLPDDALTGQEVAVAFYNGETPATLSITGNMLDFDFTPTANTRSEISALFDGQFWSIIGMSQDVPVETTEEVVTDA